MDKNEDDKPENTAETSASALNNLVMHDHILGLDDTAAIDDFKKMIGQRFPVRKECSSWGKMIVETDEMEVTKITADIDIESGDICSEMIYSNYYVDGQLKYNAWTGLKAMQSYIKKYTDA